MSSMDGHAERSNDEKKLEPSHMYCSTFTQYETNSTDPFLRRPLSIPGHHSEEPDMWTTLGLRPLIEPPILDWQWFQRKHICSDLRYRALFPNDPEKRARMKDLTGEKEMLFEYIECAKNMANVPEAPPPRRVFYTNLAQDLEEEWGQVNTEHLDLWSQASNLGRFEYRKLDNDGGTKRIEEWLHKGADFTRKYGNEVLEKYGYLLPPDFQVNELATFEFEWLDHDGRTMILRYDISKGDDVFEGCGEEVLRKYGHLRALLPTTSNAETGPVKRPRAKSCGSHEDNKRPRTKGHGNASLAYSMEARA